MNRFVLLCCFLAISALVNAQQKCVISCYAPDFKNQRAILYTYDDYFSAQLKELEIKQVDENGISM